MYKYISFELTYIIKKYIIKHVLNKSYVYIL